MLEFLDVDELLDFIDGDPAELAETIEQAKEAVESDPVCSEDYLVNLRRLEQGKFEAPSQFEDWVD